MNIIKHRKIWYIISGLFVAASLFSIFYFGLNLGIDFLGGSLLEVEYQDGRPEIEKVKDWLKNLDLGEVRVQPAGEKGLILRFKNTDEKTHQEILAALAGPSTPSVEESAFSEKRFVSIGPVIGRELKQKAWTAILLVIIMIVLYIAFAFRKVSFPLSSWKYGVAAIAALVHDVLIPAGVFSVLGRFRGVEIDALFITALLTILGFSVHDTIVVFDRIRENLKKKTGGGFEETVERSVRETIVRSVITSLTVLIVLFALFFLGGDSTKFFSLTLIIGIAVGTYSSIFLASPLLVSWYVKIQKS